MQFCQYYKGLQFHVLQRFMPIYWHVQSNIIVSFWRASRSHLLVVLHYLLGGKEGELLINPPSLTQLVQLHSVPGFPATRSLICKLTVEKVVAGDLNTNGPFLVLSN